MYPTSVISGYGTQLSAISSVGELSISRTFRGSNKVSPSASNITTTRTSTSTSHSVEATVITTVTTDIQGEELLDGEVLTAKTSTRVIKSLSTARVSHSTSTRTRIIIQDITIRTVTDMVMDMAATATQKSTGKAEHITSAFRSQ